MTNGLSSFGAGLGMGGFGIPGEILILLCEPRAAMYVLKLHVAQYIKL